MKIENCYQDFDKIRDKIKLKVLNRGMNKTIVLNSPYEEFLDMIIVPYISMPNDEESSCSITVTNKLVELWGITSQVVIDTVKLNMSNVGYTFRDMSSVITGILNDNDIDSEQDVCGYIENTNQMYVISSKDKFNGAYFGFDLNVLSKISRLFGTKKRFVILPSSIHEVIVLNSDIDNMEISDLKEMVKEVNLSEVEEQEILSYNVYYYSPSDLCVKIA